MYIHVGDPALNQFYGAVYYHENKVSEGVAEKIHDTTFIQDPTQKAQFMEAITKQNPRVYKNRGFDLAVSFHPEEQISNEEMNVLAQEVLNKLDFKQCPFVVYRHNDKPHSHFHIVVTSVDINGKKIAEHQIRKRAKTTAIELEQKYSLRHTIRADKGVIKNDYMVEHYSVARAAKKYEGTLPVDGVTTDQLYNKSMTEIKKEFGPAVATELKSFFDSKGLIIKSERQQLEELLKQTRKNTYSYTGFEKELQSKGVYVRKLSNDHIVYRLPEGNYYFDDRRVSKDFTYSKLNQYFDKGRSLSAETRSKVDPYTKRMATRAYDNSKSLDQFVTELMNKGVLVQFATYNDGRAYGVSFTNIQTGQTYKGSQMGISLNDLNKKFNEGKLTKGKQPSFYPRELKEANRLARKLGYLLERSERKDRRK